VFGKYRMQWGWTDQSMSCEGFMQIFHSAFLELGGKFTDASNIKLFQ
jgi:hypothetical protein